MNKTALTVLASLALVTGCASAPGISQPSSIYGDWVYVSANGLTGTGLDIKPDGTYSLVELALTSPNSADVQGETGTFQITATGNATVTPQRSTCRGADPAFNVTYDLQDGTLVVAFPTGVTAFKPNTAAVMGSSSLTLGCFEQNGFVVQPFAAVQ